MEEFRMVYNLIEMLTDGIVGVLWDFSGTSCVETGVKIQSFKSFVVSVEILNI